MDGLIKMNVTDILNVILFMISDTPDVEDEQDPLEIKMNAQYLKALEGFLLILTEDGEMIYLSDNVSRYLGLAQVNTLTI